MPELEGKETIRVKDKVILAIRKVDEFLNKLIHAFLSVVPWWFKLMGWLIISGAIFYVYSKYKLPGFDILFSISFSLIFFYIILSGINFLNHIHIKRYPLIDFLIPIFSIILLILLIPLLIFLLYIIFGLSLR